MRDDTCVPPSVVVAEQHYACAELRMVLHSVHQLWPVRCSCAPSRDVLEELSAQGTQRQLPGVLPAGSS